MRPNSKLARPPCTSFAHLTRRPLYSEVPHPQTVEVYEAWEILDVQPTTKLQSQTRLLGLPIKATYVSKNDEYIGFNPLRTYTQEALADMVATAAATHRSHHYRRGWLGRIGLGGGGGNGSDSYREDLKARLDAIPEVNSKVKALLSMRTVATNKSPHACREWQIVLMDPVDSPFVGVVGQQAVSSPSSSSLSSHSHHSSRGRGFQRQRPLQNWFLVIRGRTTHTSQAGFTTFDSNYNPWRKVDERVLRDRRGGGGSGRKCASH